MFRIILTLIALILTACSPPAIEAGDGPVLVTVFSPGGEASPPREGLFASYGIGIGQRAHFLDAEALAGLSRHDIRADFPVDAPPRVFSGPRLSDLMAAVGASGAGARLTAFDGYQVEVTPEMIARHQPVVATHVDGEVSAVGGLGPVILVWPRQSDERLADMNDDLWPWGVFAIETLE